MKRKRISLFLALAIALTMILGSMTTVYASEVGTATNPADIAIIKKLTVVGGVNPPDADFIFYVTPSSVDAPGQSTSTMPVIGNSGVVNVHVSGTVYDAYRKSSPYAYYTKFSDKLFAGVTWPAPGTYIYEVEEDQDSYTLKTDNPNIIEVMSYSQAKYTIKVIVKSDAGKNYAQSIIVERLVDDKGNTGTVIEKSNPVFENTFGKRSKYNGFLVAKYVQGDMADENKYFEFKFTLTIPEELKHEFYTLDYQEAFIEQYWDLGFGYADNWWNQGTEENYPDGMVASRGSGGLCIPVYSGKELTFYLKHNQAFRIPFWAPIGSSYTVTEVNPTDYVPQYKVITGGPNYHGPWGPVITGTESQSLSTGTQQILEGASGVEFTNTNDDIIITGLRMKDMPFIGMIALALASIVILAVFKSRMKKSDNYN